MYFERFAFSLLTAATLAAPATAQLINGEVVLAYTGLDYDYYDSIEHHYALRGMADVALSGRVGVQGGIALERETIDDLWIETEDDRIKAELHGYYRFDAGRAGLFAARSWYDENDATIYGAELQLRSGNFTLQNLFGHANFSEVFDETAYFAAADGVYALNDRAALTASAAITYGEDPEFFYYSDRTSRSLALGGEYNVASPVPLVLGLEIGRTVVDYDGTYDEILSLGLSAAYQFGPDPAADRDRSFRSVLRQF